MNKIKLNLSKESILFLLSELKDKDYEIEINEIDTKVNTPPVLNETNDKYKPILLKIENAITRIKSFKNGLSGCKYDHTLSFIEQLEKDIYAYHGGDTDDAIYLLGNMFKLLYSNYYNTEYSKCVDLLYEIMYIIKYIPSGINKSTINEINVSQIESSEKNEVM